MSAERLINAGATLANIAFNIAQRKPSELTTREAENLIAALDQARKEWDAARSEPEATPAPGAPAGFKLVPIEPTPEMCAAAQEQYDYDSRRGTATVASNLYRAMVEAAPGAPGQEAAAVQAEPIAWESTTEAFKRFVTDRWYQKSSNAVKRWYKPYRCSSCALTSPPRKLLHP